MPKTGLYVAAVLLLSALAAGAAAQQPPERQEPPYKTPEEIAAAHEEVARLAEIQARKEGTVLQLEAVFGFGIGYERDPGEFVFVVFVDEKMRTPELPKEIEGVPTVVRREEPPRAGNGGGGCIPCHANQLALPVQMGNSALNTLVCASCTMGFKACDLDAKVNVWVTAAHCLQNSTTCPGSAPIGNPTQHVSTGDAPSCTTATRNVGAILRHAAPGVGGNTTVDASSVSSSDSLTRWSIRDIGTPGIAGAGVLPLFTVQKSGRTTGLTTGTVGAINVSTGVSYNCGTVTMTQQTNYYGAPNTCQPGDSGAAVLVTTSPLIAGLHIAGNSAGTSCWFSSILNVLNALNLSLDPDDCPDPCPGREVGGSTSDPEGVADLLGTLRDDVLAEIGYGRRQTKVFEAVSREWSGLYVRHPRLLAGTAKALEANLDVIKAIVARREIRVSRERIQAIDRLLARHLEAAEDPKLKAAFKAWRADLRDEAVQRQFGVLVED